MDLNSREAKISRETLHSTRFSQPEVPDILVAVEFQKFSVAVKAISEEREGGDQSSQACEHSQRRLQVAGSSHLGCDHRGSAHSSLSSSPALQTPKNNNNKTRQKIVREEDRVLEMIKQHFKVSVMLPAIYRLAHFINVRFPPGNTCFEKIIIALMSRSGKQNKKKNPNKQKLQTNKQTKSQRQ